MSFEPKKFEEKIYNACNEGGFFSLEGNSKIQKDGKVFSLMMPPPNVTGVLHIGHALTFTLQDIITRYKRMDGYKTLWQCGTDHAGIATQNVVIRELAKEGKTKEELGRDGFIERVKEWKEFSGNTIIKQMKKLGITPDWDRERFTMDEGLVNSVKEVFTRLYNEGYIVKDSYMINWCVNDGALSDIEVEHSEVAGKLYHIKYYISGSDEYLTLATTRPETLFGDSAIMVHPDDDRYKKYIGKSVKIPIINREIKIIADSYVDVTFGTGVVKVTPAHDYNDYEVGLRHKLEFYTIFDTKGVLNDLCGEFSGLNVSKARSKVVDRLKELGFIVSIDEHIHQVGHCYRCKSVVEPYISKQWFVRKEIAIDSIDKVREGLVKFFPPNWINSYNAWMSELKDWCISRQLWWGHRIPVFYCDDCLHVWASVKDETVCSKCNSKNIHQDSDVLDTWFSSALWSFTTLGKFNGSGSSNKYSSDDLETFYPNSLLITGFDILFFWVARMMMMGEHFLGELPFKHIYLHALVRDEHGDKMSKSKGNVIDPLELVDEYSADIVRFTLASLTVMGRDIKVGKKHLDVYKNFTNKLYNASRYLLMNEKKFEDLRDIEIKTGLGRYMLSRLSSAISDVRINLDSYRFSDVAVTLYKFFWDDFCDWGIELSKCDSSTISELGAIFKEGLKLLCPIMPFISEKLYAELSGYEVEDIGKCEPIMVKNYPILKYSDKSAIGTFNSIKELIVTIRRVKANIEQSKLDIVYIKVTTDNKFDFVIMGKYLQKLCKIEKVELVNSDVPECLVTVMPEFKVYIPKGSIDVSSLIIRLNKRRDKLVKEYDKIKLMLSNDNFTKNAPKELVEKNEIAMNELKDKIDNIDVELATYSGL